MANIASQRMDDCPLCHSSRTGYLFKSNSWTIGRCAECTNAWTVPPPAPINYKVEDFHSGFKYREINDLPRQWRWPILKQVDELISCLFPNAKILEIGCGEGLLLRELARKGFEVCGIEPSGTASLTARRSGLNVINGKFPGNIPFSNFDAVVVSHVLEHVSEPIGFLKEMEKIASGGVALFAQSNWKGLVPRIHRKRWYAWAPENHYWHFSPKGLRLILERFNWKTLKTEYSSLYHENSVISVIGSLLPNLGDQFHLLSRIASDTRINE